MLAVTDKKKFLTDEVLRLLKELKEDASPSFGIMTAQHMVEHLIYITRSSVKDHGKPQKELTKEQLFFRKFIESGAVFKHHPSEQTKKDLPQLKYDSLSEAVEQIALVIDDFYNHYKTDAICINYHPVIGNYNFKEIELFHFQHYRYHLWQFGLIVQYP